MGWITIAIVRRQSGRFMPLFAAALLGYLAIQPWSSPLFPPDHIVHYAGTEKWTISGLVDSQPEMTHDRLRFILRADRLTETRGRAQHLVSGRVRVTVSRISALVERTGRARPIAMGDRVDVISKIKRPRNFHNPGGFDYERFMSFQGIWATAFVPSDRVHAIARGEKTELVHKIEEARQSIISRINSQRPLGGLLQEKAVLRALIVGDRSGIDQSLRDIFNRAGIGHLLAISGLHVGIVATVSFFLFRWILSFVPALLWRAWVRKGSAILSLIPVICYGLLAGMSPSTQRAVLMIAVFLLTFLYERDQDMMNTLALAAIVILLLHPPALYSVSFLMSFAAVYSILYGLSHLPKSWRLTGAADGSAWILRVCHRCRLFLFVSLFAILGTLPITMLFFNQVSLIGLLSNCLMVPLVGFLVVPIGLLGALVCSLALPGADLVLQSGLALLKIALFIARWLSALPFAALKTITPNLIEIGGYFLAAWGILRAPSRPGGPSLAKNGFVQLPPRNRSVDRPIPGFFRQQMGRLYSAVSRHSLSAMAILLAAAIFLVDGCYWYGRRFLSDDLRLTAVDVGQGAAVLLELPGGRCILVDGGGFSDNTVFDVGERIIAPLLWRRKIMTVDTLVLTHPNSDHLNGLLYIANHFHVESIWMTDDTAGTLGYRMLESIMHDRGIHRSKYRNLARVDRIGGVVFEILYPPGDVGSRPVRESWRDLNNNSMVLRVTYGQHVFLLPGDIMAHAEKELVAQHGDHLKSTVLVSPHHGSRTSSTHPFMLKVDPDYVVIPAGWGNSFGFPHKEVLRRYLAMGCRVYSTGDHGAVQITTDGDGLRIDTVTKLPVLRDMTP